MLKLSANISLLYRELEFLDRVGAAAQAGFTAVEVMYPYDHPADDLAKALHSHAVQLSVINAPPGNHSAGERGLACLPGREAAFRATIDQAVQYATITGCQNIHVLTGNLPQGIDRHIWENTLRGNLMHAAERFAQASMVLLLEPLSRQMLPDYSLTTVEQASFWRRELGAAGFSNVALQLDLYHTQMEQGNLAAIIQRHIDEIQYVQIAGVPGRHEPTIGEVNYRFLLGLLEKLNFAGWVGCEYIPRSNTEEGLQWAREWGFLHAPKPMLPEAH